VSLRNEIFEQADVLQNLLDSEWQGIQRIAEKIKNRNIKYIFFTARGTSDNAGLYAKYLLGINNHLPVALSAPSMFSIYQSAPRLEDALVLAFSQSGQSPDIVKVIEEGRRQGAMTLAITNATDSPLAEAADEVIDMRAGEEKAVAATKSYTAEMMVSAMISAALKNSQDLHSDLKKVPGFISQALEMDQVIQQAAEQFSDVKHSVIVGRGYNYATAFEWALKMEELTYIISKAYSSADFLHGPIAMVELGFPVFMIAPSGKVFQDLQLLAKKLKNEKQARLLVLSDREEILDFSSAPLKLPGNIPEWISPITSIVPAQLFCMALARLRGLDTENPRGLSKVTLTT